ncbi:LmeA family phospholipid-binding protein [Arthrobacter sp. TMN-37]
MEWTRAKDWLIGAVGMVLVLGVAVVIFWWVVSEPAGRREAGPGPSPTEGADQLPGAGPPADLRGDEVWLGDLELDAGTVATGGSLLRDVRAVGQDVVTGPDGTVAARLAVDATVPFEVIADELGGGSVVRAADNGQATVVRTVEVLGRELRVTATGSVEAQDGRLVVEPRSIDIGGPDFLSDATAAVVRGFVTIEHDIEGLPEGLLLQDVAVQGDGFRANLRGDDVELAR